MRRNGRHNGQVLARAGVVEREKKPHGYSTVLCCIAPFRRHNFECRFPERGPPLRPLARPLTPASPNGGGGGSGTQGKYTLEMHTTLTRYVPINL